MNDFFLLHRKNFRRWKFSRQVVSTMSVPEGTFFQQAKYMFSKSLQLSQSTINIETKPLTSFVDSNWQRQENDFIA